MNNKRFPKLTMVASIILNSLFLNLILVTIGQILKKWQPFFEIHDGSGRHLELWLLRLFNIADVF